MESCPASELIEHEGIAVPKYQCMFSGNTCYSDSFEECNNKEELGKLFENIISNHLGINPDYYQTIGIESIREHYDL